MSTATAERRGFTAPAAQQKPDLICVGRVSKIADTKVSQSGAYLNTKIEIEPLGAGFNAKVNLLHRPEWLTNMSAEELQNLDSSATFVYQKNIRSRDDMSTLRGLSQSDEAFNELAADLIDLGPDSEIEAFSDTVRKHVPEDRLIGYILTQKKEDTGEVDGNGKKIKVLARGYDVASWFDVNEKTLTKLTEKAERSKGKMRLTYNGEAF
jgi:hypothetical protein